MSHLPSTRPRWWRLIAVVLSVGMIAAACGGGDESAAPPDGDNGGGDDEPTGPPQMGGSVTYGVEAETTGGYCLTSSQLAISGILVAQALYDTLVVPNEDGEYVPHLAESVEPNETFDQWTITLRPDITFHNGEPLDAEAVKLNLDTYRGENPDNPALLFVFVLEDIESVEVVDPLTVQVNTAVPWVGFDSYLFSTGRLGMMAPEQINNPDTCDTNMIGTGPFSLVEWRVNDVLIAERNEDYWRSTEIDGETYQLPFLDEIRFQPTPDATQRTNGLETGDLTMAHQSSGNRIVELRDLDEAGTIDIVASEGELAELTYLMTNAENPPFDNPAAREAIAAAIDRERLNELFNGGIGVPAPAPYAPGSVGHVEDSGYPAYDPARAEELVEQVREETGEFSVTYTFAGNAPDDIRTADEIVSMLNDVGIDAETNNVPDQSRLINDALTGQFQLLGFRNHPGGDPDGQYVWWYSTSPVNFGNIDSPEMDALLDAGRSETDPDARAEIYEDISRLFGAEVYNAWQFYVTWAIGHQNNVQGILGAPLPNGDLPYPILAGWHQMSGIWISE